MAFITLNSDEKKQLTDIAELGYEFDWTLQSSDKSITVAFSSNGDISGLVEFERRPETILNYMWLIEVSRDYRGTGVAGKLLAYVARDSIGQGFDGFVMFEPKTALYQYYIDKYGAKSVRPGHRTLHFDTEASMNLIKTYLMEDYDND